MPEEMTDLKAKELAENIEALVIDAYTDETERENARQVMRNLYGIDTETGLKTSTEKDAADALAEQQKADADAADKAAKDAADKEAADKAAADKAAADKAAADKAAADKTGDGTADKTGDGTGDDDAHAKELASMREQLAARDAEITRLSAKQYVANAQPEIEKDATENLKELRSELDAAAETDKKRVADAESEYGETVAKAFREIMAENQKLRDARYDEAHKAEVQKLRQVKETESEGAARLDADIRAVPEIYTMREAAIRKEPGALAKYQIAMGIDETLRTHPDWSGKTQVERFQEVARRVALMLGDAPGAAAPPADDKTPPADPKKTAEQIDAELKKQAGKTNRADTKDGPGTMSGVQGGDPPAADLMTRVEKAEPMDVLAMGLSVDAIDKLIIEREQSTIN